MKILNLAAILCLFFSTPTFAHNDNGGTEPTPNLEPNTNTVSFYNIFFSDSENEVLFIDFEVVQESIKSINILKDGKILMNDDVSDLAGNEIYELFLDTFREGEYIVEIVTEHNIRIQKEVKID